MKAYEVHTQTTQATNPKQAGFVTESLLMYTGVSTSVEVNSTVSNHYSTSAIICQYAFD
jgi:hypothetical protein